MNINTCHKKETKNDAQVHTLAASMHFVDLPPGSDRAKMVAKGVSSVTLT